MKLALLSFTEQGAALCRRLCEKLSSLGHACQGFSLEKYAQNKGLCSFGGSLSAWTKAHFSRECLDGLLFIGACGIAVRAVAPYLRGKDLDPAVVVVDEGGRFAISLLSGHLGGANLLTALVAEQIGATPVISTATDCRGLFAVDSWAAQRGWALSDLGLAKAVSAQLLAGEAVGFCADIPVSTLPTGLSLDTSLKLGVCATIYQNRLPFPQTLRVIPRVVTLGIGCRKGIGQSVIEEAVQAACSAFHIDKRAVAGLASIDLKQHEPGLLAFAKHHALPLRFFSAKQLQKAPGTFTASPFVKQVAGVENVCERAAVLASGGTLLFPKQAGQGVTVAAACAEWRISFED